MARRIPLVPTTAPPTGLAAIPAQTVAATRCRRCARTAPSEQVRVHGVWSVIDQRPVWECTPCARANLFEIETGIPDSATWVSAAANRIS